MRVMEIENVSETKGSPADDHSWTTSGQRPRGRRLFMAGRVDGEVQQVKFARSVRAPIRGPWSLALVVRPG